MTIALSFLSRATSRGMISLARLSSCPKTPRKIHSTKKTHETEVTDGIYDLEVFKAIDQARARLQKADRDLEALRNELSYREGQVRLGR